MKTKTNPALTLSAEVSAEIAKRSADSGIPVRDLANMMAKAGLEQYDGPGLVIRKKDKPDVGSKPDSLPVLTDTVHVTHGYEEGEWRRIQKKAKAQGCDALALLNTVAAMLGSTNELVPIWLPQRIVLRLHAAGETADISDPFDGIAEAVLGDLVERPAELLDLLSSQWPDVSKKRLAAVNRLAKQWRAEDAKAKTKPGNA